MIFSDFICISMLGRPQLFYVHYETLVLNLYTGKQFHLTGNIDSARMGSLRACVRIREIPFSYLNPKSWVSTKILHLTYNVIFLILRSGFTKVNTFNRVVMKRNKCKLLPWEKRRLCNIWRISEVSKYQPIFIVINS